MCCLQVRRPSNFDMSTAIMLGPTTPDPAVDTSSLTICQTLVEDSPHKLFIGMKQPDTCSTEAHAIRTRASS